MARKYLSIAILLLLCLLAGCTGSVEPLWQETGDPVVEDMAFFATIRVDGVDISGLTMEEALARVESAHKDALKGKSITVTLDGKNAMVPLDALSFSYDTSQVLTTAFNAGRTGSPEEQRAEREALAAQGMDYNTTRTLSEGAQSALASFVAELSTPAVDAAATLDFTREERLLVSEAIPGKQVDVAQLTQLINRAIAAGDYTARLDAPYETVEPAVTTEQAKTSIVMVSTYTSSFKTGNGANRVFNLEKAAGLINGTVLLPGEIFDTNAVLGPRSLATGWKAAHAINDGTFVDEPGGGVCQISSTLFNAVLMADLEIVERRPHSWPIGYIPIGRDATISTGGPNFRFKNNTDAPVYVSMYLLKDELTVTAEVYGAPLPDGKTIKIVSEKTGSLASKGTKYEIDESLSSGKSKEVRKARTGQRSVTFKEYYDANGNLIERKQILSDTYPSIMGIVLVAPDHPNSGITQPPSNNGDTQNGEEDVINPSPQVPQQPPVIIPELAV